MSTRLPRWIRTRPVPVTLLLLSCGTLLAAAAAAPRALKASKLEIINKDGQVVAILDSDGSGNGYLRLFDTHGRETALFPPVQSTHANPASAPKPSQPTPTLPSSDAPISARIDGDFDGFDYGKLFLLNNGQVWKQVEFHIHIAARVNPGVLLFKENGSWKLKVDGHDRAVRVELIK